MPDFIDRFTEFQDANSRFDPTDTKSMDILKEKMDNFNQLVNDVLNLSPEKLFGNIEGIIDTSKIKIPEIKPALYDANGNPALVNGRPMLKLMVGGTEVMFEGKNFGDALEDLKQKTKEFFKDSKDSKTALQKVGEVSDLMARTISDAMGVDSLKDGISENIKNQADANYNEWKTTNIGDNNLKGVNTSYTEAEIISGKASTEMPKHVIDTIKEKTGLSTEQINEKFKTPEGATEVLDQYAKNVKTPAEKSFLEKVKEAVKNFLYDNWLKLGLAAFFTYEFLSVISKDRSGCIVSSSNNDGMSMCKMIDLSCGDYKETNANMPACGGNAPPEITPAPTPSPNPSCTGSDGKDLKCKEKCSDTYFNTKSLDGRTNISTSCKDCGFACAIQNVAEGLISAVINSVEDAANAGSAIVNTIIKYGIYIVVGIVCLIVISKLLGFVFSGGGGHSFGRASRRGSLYSSLYRSSYKGK